MLMLNRTGRTLIAGAMAAGMLSMLAGCGDPPRTTSTTYDQTTTSSPPMRAPAMPVPVPGSVTTQTTHTQTLP